jgi:8-oxo-dGTP diphosphatase
MEVFRRLPGPIRRLAVHLGAPSYTVGAVALLRRSDGRVLLVDQRHSPGWALPGGLLRRGETPAAAVVREVAEEVGVQLDVAHLPQPVAATNARARRVDLIYVIEGMDSKAATIDEAEVRRVGWFALDSLPDVSEPTLDILRAVHAA